MLNRDVLSAGFLAAAAALPVHGQETIAIPGEAQPSAPAAPQKAPVSRLIDEVVVTAQKREENLQEVPISVAAFTAEQLDARGIDDPKDLQASTPGLTYGSQVAFSIIYLRGVGSDAYLTADPSVATYIDGIYFPFASGQAQSFGALERIEVLKGPQGTLFGRNTTGGAINIITKKPGQTPETSVQLSYGSFESAKTRVYTNVPIADNLAFSASVVYDNSDGYYDFRPESPIRTLPRDVNRGARIKLGWEISDDADLVLGYFRIRQSGTNTTLEPNTAPSQLVRTLGGRPQPRDYTASVDAPFYFDISNEVVYGDFNASTPWFDIRVLGSDQSLINHGQTDFDGTPLSIASFSAPLFADIQTAELQFLSNESSWGSDWLEWIVGAYYLKGRQGLTPTLSLLAGEQGDVLGVQLDTLLGLLPTPIRGLLGGVPLLGGVKVRLSGRLDTEALATFAQSTIHFTDDWSIILGLRYQTEQRDMVDSRFGLEQLNGSPIYLLNYAKDSKSDSNLTPKVSLNYKLDEDTLIYASWQRGFKSGTYNVINIYDRPEYVDPEEVTAIELGLKTDLFDGLVRFNAAIFQTKIKDLQQQFVSLLTGGAVTLENAAGMRVRGAEFDLIAQLFPDYVDALVLTASASYLDAIYTSYPDGSGFAEVRDLQGNVRDDTFGLFTKSDFSGNDVVRTPKFSGTVGLSKTWEIWRGALELAGDVYYNSGYNYLPQNSKVFEQKAYEMLTARLSYLYQPWTMRVTVFGDNLGDKAVAYGYFSNDFGRLEPLAPPRSFGVRLNWDF